MPSVLRQQFSSAKDVRYLKARDAEKHRLYFQPRRWLVHQRDTTPLNIYGEPGELPSAIVGTDGVTSIPATRQFTSAGSDFVAAGVNVTDVLEIFNAPADTKTSTQEDNGRYLIELVTAHVLTVDQNWPHGSRDAPNFRVHILKERYVAFEQLVSFMVRLNPTKKELDKWGISEQRDARIELSMGLLEEISLVPKIGDRFILPYGIGTRNMTYEVKNLYETDQLSDSGIPLHFVGFAKRVTLPITPT